jgi:hypothetical protein
VILIEWQTSPGIKSFIGRGKLHGRSRNSISLHFGRDDNSVVAGIDATEPCPTRATELSSRPERSVVEGPAVSPLPTHNSDLSNLSPLVIPTEAEGSAVSPHPTHNSNLSNFSTLVIPTGAKRSGGICSFSPSHSQLPLEQPLSPCHPDRSEAQWRDLQCALRLSPILPGKTPGATNPQPNPYPNPISQRRVATVVLTVQQSSHPDRSGGTCCAPAAITSSPSQTVPAPQDESP